MKKADLLAVDMFCGAGGASTGELSFALNFTIAQDYATKKQARKEQVA